MSLRHDDERTFRTQVVAAALLDDPHRPQRLIAAQRAYPESLRGLWELPGGKQEPGETVQEALHRECRGELGVRIRLLEEVPGPHRQGWPLSESAAMRVWTAVVVAAAEEQEADADALGMGRQAEGADHLELRWVRIGPEPIEGLQEAEALPWIPADLPILDGIRRHLAG
ncbi:NUDIX domain-containing protein [Kocuria palustris]|uniref:NUDIX domain-containing protein n=1 Tax=Kocuria palustris TaxID=71999 RepID=UPI000738DDBE|nr:NUDIX domain-containing protein [Kocuria palustris]KUG51386.1 DNA mismatch repair protein MutT [Kocuria palustris]